MIPGTPSPESGTTTVPTQTEVDGILGEGGAPEQTPPEGGEGTPEPSAPGPEAEAQPQQEEGTPAEEEEAAPQPGEEGYLWAGRYKTPQDMERGINDIRALQARTAEKANRLQAQLQQAAGYVQQVAQAWQRQQQQGQQPAPAQTGEGLDEDTLKVLQPLIDEQVNKVRQEFQQGLQAQQQQQQAAADQQERQTAVRSFFETHSEMMPGDEMDQEVTSVLTELEWGPYAEELEIAYEIAKDPALRKIIRANPAWADTDDGLDFARQAAGAQPPATRNAAGTEAQRRAASRAHVETGGGGTTPVQSKPKDEVDEMLAEAAKGKGNVFGIGG